MTKIKTPILSLGASGSVGDTLSYLKRGQTKIAEHKPTPTDRRTLLQVYQRWLYQDYVALWHTFSPPQKQQWETDARPYKMTGFAFYMKQKLRALPDIAGLWHLDYVSATKTPDSSKNSNIGTVYGATPSVGIIDNCLHFDGVNDYVSCGNDPSLDILDAISVEIVVYPLAYSTRSVAICKGWDHAWEISIRSGGIVRMGIYTSTGEKSISNAGTAPLSQWSHLCMTYDRQYLRGWVRGIQATPNPQTEQIKSSLSRHVLLGAVGTASGVTAWFQGYLDEAIIHNIAIPETMVLNHSARRYP